MTKYKKTYVGVTAFFTPEGKILPEKIHLENGGCFRVDKVLDIRPAASLKAGGAGIRYTVRINLAEKHLFLEENRWFIEEICKN